MCLIVVLNRQFDDVPLLLLANREEAFARGGEPLGWRQGRIPFLSGLDPQAGGAWLGINAHRLVVAVTNRPKSQPPPNPRSRGLLVLDLLEFSSARHAMERGLQLLSPNAYRGCNLLLADMESTWIVHGGDWLRVRSLAPGVHVLTNGDINDPSDDRIRWINGRLTEAAPRDPDAALSVLREIAGSTVPPVPICLTGETRGTVASTLLKLCDQPRRSQLLHAHGAPDRTAFSDRTDLLWELEGWGAEHRS